MVVCVHSSIGVRVFVAVSVPMLIGPRVRMAMRVLVRVRMLVLVILNRMSVIVLVGFVRDDVDFGSGEAAAHDLPALQTRTDVQGCHRVLKYGEGYAGIDEGTEKHVAGDAGEAFEIRDSHQANCKRLGGIPVRRQRSGAAAQEDFGGKDGIEGA